QQLRMILMHTQAVLFNLELGNPALQLARRVAENNVHIGLARRRIDMKTKRRALLLQGGGALGAYEYGAIKALYELPGFSLDVVTGVSIGAINAAVLVGAKDDPIRALDELWRKRLAIRNWPFVPPMLDRYSSLLANPAMYWMRPSYVYA